MAHHLDRPIASDLSYQTLQLRRFRGELAPQVCDSRHLPFHLIASVPARKFIADPDCGQPETDRGRREGQ